MKMVPSSLRLVDYAVLGMGAIGGSLAHHLASTGHSVTGIDADPDHVHAVRDEGLTLVRADGSRATVALTAVYTPAEAEEAGIRPQRIILSTKAQNVAGAAEWLAPHLADEGFVVLCQNRDTFDDAASFLGASRVVSAFVNFAADVLGPGTIRVGGPGEMAIGEYGRPVSGRVRSVVADLRGFGHVSATDNIAGYLWAKRGVAAILTATSLVDEHVSVVIDSAREVMSELVTEVYAVSDARGVRLENIDGIDVRSLTSAAPADERRRAFDRLVEFTGSMPGKERSGVFRDIAVRKRPTEARPDLLDLARLAQAQGIPTPRVDALAVIIGELETGRRSFGRANLDDLAAPLTTVHAEHHK